MPTDPTTRESRLADAERIIASQPVALMKWLEAEKLNHSDASGPVHNATWESSLKSRGLLDAARAWLQLQKERLTIEFPVTGHKGVAREIAWRYSMAKMMQESGGMKKVKKKKPVSDEAQSSLPPDLRYVYNHPVLDDDADTSSVIFATTCEKYERDHPCPSQGAKNYLSWCKKDEKARSEMFKKVDTFLLQSMRIKKEAVVSEVDEKEKSRVLDMRAERDKLAAKYQPATMTGKS